MPDLNRVCINSEQYITEDQMFMFARHRTMFNDSMNSDCGHLCNLVKLWESSQTPTICTEKPVLYCQLSSLILLLELLQAAMLSIV